MLTTLEGDFGYVGDIHVGWESDAVVNRLLAFLGSVFHTPLWDS